VPPPHLVGVLPVQLELGGHDGSIGVAPHAWRVRACVRALPLPSGALTSQAIRGRCVPPPHLVGVLPVQLELGGHQIQGTPVQAEGAGGLEAQGVGGAGEAHLRAGEGSASTGCRVQRVRVLGLG